jgi:cytochrome P450
MVDPPALPGPAEPAEEQVRRWIESPIDFWAHCGRTYGPVTALELGSLGSVVLIADPDQVAEVFRLSRDDFEVHQYNEHYRLVMGEEAVLVQDGQKHLRQRKLLNPLVHPKRTVEHLDTMREVAERIIGGWPAGEPFNPRPRLHLLTFTVMMHLLLGTDQSDAARELLAFYEQEIVPRVGSWGPWRRFERSHGEIATILEAEMSRRRDDASIPGMLTHLLHGKDDEGIPLTDTEVLSHVYMLMIAGVDTTAITLSWCLYWLAREPESRRRLVEELANNEWRVDASVLDLPYLDAVFAETLRMYPTVPTPSGRRLLKAVEIGGRRFEAGTTLVPCSYLVHRSEELYEEGDRFDPARFVDQRRKPSEHFPFGGGVRTCLGRPLAPIEFKVALATALREWELDDWNGDAVEPTRHGILIAPDEKFRITVRPRQAAMEAS